MAMLLCLAQAKSGVSALASHLISFQYPQMIWKRCSLDCVDEQFLNNLLYLRVHYHQLWQISIQNALLSLLNHQRSPFLYDVAKKFQKIFVWVFWSHVCKFENKYGCLNWDATSSLKVLMVSVVGYLVVWWLYKNDMKAYAAFLVWLKCFPYSHDLSMHSCKQSNLAVIPISGLYFILHQ